MASATPTETHTAHHEYDRPAMNRLGLWLFLISDSFFFAALISSRFYLHGVGKPDELNQFLALGLTAILLVSSLSAYRAETAAAHGDLAVSQRNILITIVLGLAFLVGVGFEWREAFHFAPPSSGFGTILFTLTGVHATHVLSGVIALLAVYRLGRDGRYAGKNPWPVEGAVKYWHLVDVAWVFIYPTLYLVN